MTGPLIRDIPSIKKSLDDLKNLRAFRQVMPLLHPILQLLKVDIEKLDDTFVNFDQLEQMAEELSTVPDRFNDLFAERGWIIHDIMSFEVAKAAVDKAEAGDIDGAEDDIINYYDPETIGHKLRMMVGIQAFRPRMRLAEKALDDYCNERYHACVPVVLALLDGLVNELHEKRLGFFAEEVNLEAWDSMAAHSKGLNVLADIFKKGRRKTNVEQISVPYRNGIMHGMDLGYDNKIVAAKTWAALFAVRDWAMKAEQGLLKAPPKEPQKMFSELVRQIRDLEDDKKLLEAWEPRSVYIGKDVPASGEPDSFERGTPEHRLAEFIGYWKARNYGYMAKLLSANLGLSESKLAGQMREKYAPKHLKAFEFVEIIDKSASVTEILTRLLYEEQGEEVPRIVRYRIVYEDTSGSPTIPGKPDSNWTIIEWNTV